MKFNDVFKANNYAGRKKVLDRFPLSKEDKDNVNKSIEKLSNSNGGGNDGAFTYKSRKVVWKIVDMEKFEGLKELLNYIPIYSAVCFQLETGAIYYKYYGPVAYANLIDYVAVKNDYYSAEYIEESEGFGVYNGIDTNEGLLGIIKFIIESQGHNYDYDTAIAGLKVNFGIEPYPYEDYIKLDIYSDNKFANF